MDHQLAYFTDWLQQYGARRDDIDRFARCWRRSVPALRPCPVCFTDPRARGKAQVVALAEAVGPQGAVCGKCSTRFEMPRPAFPWMTVTDGTTVRIREGSPARAEAGANQAPYAGRWLA